MNCLCNDKSYCSNTCREKRILKLQVLYPQEDWVSQRQGYANSSSLWSIIKGWKSAFDHDRIRNDVGGWTACKHGKAYEPVALEYLRMKHGMKIKHCGSVPHDNGLIRASPDGLMIWNDKLVNIEIKCPVNSNNMSGKSLIYEHQYHSAALCCKTEQVYFVKFLFREEYGKWEYDKGFPPGTWGKNCIAYGYFTNKWRNDFKLFIDGEPPNVPQWAVKFNLERIREKWEDPVDVITPNLEQIKSFIEELRSRRMPSTRQLVDIKTYLKNFANVDEIYIDKFWTLLFNKKKIIIDDEIVEWFGYEPTKSGKKTMRRMLRRKCPDVEEITYAQAIESNPDLVIKQKVKYRMKMKFAVLKRKDFKKLCMTAPNDRGEEIRKYYMKMEEVFENLLEDIMFKRHVLTG